MTDQYYSISQGRRTIVFGLEWFTREQTDTPAKIAGALANDLGSDYNLICLRADTKVENQIQLGMGRSSSGAKAGAVSAASMIANFLDLDTWIYVLDLEGKYWVCAGREGLVLPQGDRVFPDIKSAVQAFNELNPSGFKRIFLPASWKSSDMPELKGHVDEAETTDLMSFLSLSAPKWGKMRSRGIKLSLSRTTIIKMVLVAVLGGTALWFYYPQQTQTGPSIRTPAELAAARAALIKREQSEREARWAVLDARRPWEDRARPERVYSACLKAIRDMPGNPVGYEIVSFTCSPAGVDAQLKRKTGYSSWLEEWADLHQGISATTDPSGTSGYLTSAIPALSARGEETLVPFKEISRQILESGQIEGASIKLTSPAVRTIPDEPDYVPTYATSQISLSTTRPDVWYDVFSETPGLVIKKVTMNPSDSVYLIEGEINVPNL